MPHPFVKPPSPSLNSSREPKPIATPKLDTLPAAVPLDVQLPLDWTKGDASNLNAFLNGPTGVKLRQHLFMAVMSRSLPLTVETATPPAVIYGMEAMREELLSLAIAELFGDAEENA
jgi:hypothetical protein